MYVVIKLRQSRRCPVGKTFSIQIVGIPSSSSPQYLHGLNKNNQTTYIMSSKFLTFAENFLSNKEEHFVRNFTISKCCKKIKLLVSYHVETLFRRHSIFSKIASVFISIAARRKQLIPVSTMRNKKVQRVD